MTVEVIGRKELVHFPEWQLFGIPAKIDTGARSCALDALSYAIRESHGVLVAEIRVDIKRRRKPATIHAPLLGMVNVSNSNGGWERRPVVETTIELGTMRRQVRLSLTNRSGLRFPMILGRSAIAGAFLVDVSRAFVLGRSRRQTKRSQP